MTGKVLILTGAPDSSQLDWSDLLTTFQPAIAQFALLQPPAPSSTANKPTTHQDQAVWRSLPLHRTHIRTGFSQQHDLHFVGAFPSSADFLNTVLISQEATSQALSQEEADEQASRLIADFYEHSLAAHDALASSQLVPHHPEDSPQALGASAAAAANDASFASDTTTTTTTTTGMELEEEAVAAAAAAAAAGGGHGASALAAAHATPKAPLRAGRDRLSDLAAIPPAAHLLSILPATATVTLVAGVISIAAPRTVATRYGAAAALVEVLVGDETKSGFSITFWLAADARGGGGGGGGDDGGSAAVLRGLRRQDVVLLQNVALSVFRKQVYGASLRLARTKVELLYRGRTAGEGDVGGYYDGKDLAMVGKVQVHPQLEKTRRVRDWVLKFVGGEAGTGETKACRTRKGKEREMPRAWNQPPPLDTQQ